MGVSALLCIALRGQSAADLQTAPPPATAPATAPALEVEIILESPPASTWNEVTFEAVGAKTDAEPVARFVAMIREELSLYSPAFMQSARLRGIVVVRNLRVEGQPRAVVPDPEKGVMYVDPTIGAHNPVYQRHALHHDFFHFLMGRFEGDMYFKDPAWIALNAPNTSYGNGGVNAQQGRQYAMTHPAPGFVNLYSQSAVEEDMGEVFAALQIPEERRLLLKWAREDAVLKRKIAYMAAFVARHSAPGEEPPATTKPAG